ncbi:MAG: ribonuclease III [Alphaproteobacteria bacterium]|nr:ribonuclease III [Alphaproteobacteria bacterium]
MNLNYKFQDKKLLDLALTQSGVDSDHNNERLEFVGDRVLGLAVARLLYEMFPDESEGELARRHAFLVSTETLADVAIKIGLDHDLRHGHLTGGRIRHTLANAMEAVLGAIFFDSDFDTVRNLIVEIWRDLAAMNKQAPKDSKTALQEFVQKHTGGGLPVYECVGTAGATHSPVFTVSVAAMGKNATGVGTSKKNAEIAAAAELLKKLAI